LPASFVNGGTVRVGDELTLPLDVPVAETSAEGDDEDAACEPLRAEVGVLEVVQPATPSTTAVTAAPVAAILFKTLCPFTWRPVARDG
jgi:hypothetical protein